MVIKTISEEEGRLLTIGAGYKPLDFGGYGTTGSVNLDGQITAINTYHPEHGYITVTSARTFTEKERYNSDAVRNYRRKLVDLDGFGLNFNMPIVDREIRLLQDAIPHNKLILKDGSIAHLVSYVTTHGSQIFVIQRWSFENLVAPITGYWRGTISIQRSAYTQLTEGGPVLPPAPDTRWHRHPAHPDAIVLENRVIQQQVYIGGLPQFDRIHPATHRGRVHMTVPFTAEEGRDIYLQYAISQSSAIPIHVPTNHASQQALTIEVNRWKKLWQGWTMANHPLDLEMRRGLVYGLHCSVPVFVDANCILTDHILLPLSWNRDSYYTAVALLRWNTDMADVVRKHLVWLFEVAQRVDGSAWARAYLANGRVKDDAFQLDQQIYPMMELAAYVLKTGDTAMLERVLPKIQPVVDMLLSRKANGAFLFPTDETPADDPIELPYHFSSHVLMWYMFDRLARMDIDETFEQLAQQARDAIDRYFIAEHNGVKMYAYATDNQGNFRFYHDANDMPLAFAPLWGMLPADDPVWRATIDFAFSTDNDGVYDGFLGSVHTPAPWPLGDVQELLVARSTGDEAREHKVEARIRRSSQWDGALPEAYDAETYEVVSRNWFAWPNAMLAYIELIEKR